MVDVRARLTAPELPRLATALGLQGADLDDALAAARSVADTEADLARVEELAGRLVDSIGELDVWHTENPLDCEAASGGPGVGVLAMLALLATAPEVAAYHARRGVDATVSERSLSDLGQQAAVHRLTYGEFGLHTYLWMRIAWSGGLFWLGRLQFNLQRADEGWTLSTHIPATGPLTPAAVDASFGWARTFFAEHFPDRPTTDFFCSSWLLDPHLGQTLPESANLARFQRRWSLYGEPMPGDDDALFFTFHRRGQVDLAELPRETTLQRVIVDRLQSGRGWQTWQGRIPQATAVSGGSVA
jgi:hypothetical protein